MPTILDITDIPLPNNIHGKSLLPILSGEYDLERPFVLSELFKDAVVYRFGDEFKRDLKSFRSNEWKYINSSNDKNELYNLINDKKEIINLVKTENEMAVKMETLKNEYLKSLDTTFYDKDAKAEVSNNIKEKLKTLGYIQ